MNTDTARRHPFADNGALIRKARRRTGLSQERFALEIETTRRHIIRLENGEHLPSVALRDRIAARTGEERGSLRAADDDEEAAQVNHRDLLEALHGAIGVALGKTSGTQQSPPHTLIGTRDGLRPQGA